MKNENCEILLEYLRSILYDSEIRTLNLQQLEEPYRELGAEIQVLQKVVERIRSYSKTLSRGGRSESFSTIMEQLCGKEACLTQKADQGAFAHIITDITQEKAEKEKLASKVYRDSLTGIQNRFYFEEKMTQILEDGAHFTLCYIDLDNLKQVNDEYGHRVGDDYIRSFVSMVRSRIREYDIFARIGGDEFCLVFLECRKDVAARKMKQILEEFMCIGVDIVSNESRIVFSFSYGLIEEAGESAPKTVDEILSLADKKMYEMKRLHKRKV